MSINVTCEFCGQSVRLRDDAAGRVYTCKNCGTKLRVPEPDDAEGDFFGDEPPPLRYGDRSRRRERDPAPAWMTLVPAIGLYVTEAMVFLLIVFSIFFNSLKPDRLGVGMNPAEAMGEQFGFYFSMIAHLVLTVVVMGGAYCLQIRRHYGLALAACILATIPCCTPCMGLGIPFGIWGIVVLCLEDVRASFR